MVSATLYQTRGRFPGDVSKSIDQDAASCIFGVKFSVS